MSPSVKKKRLNVAFRQVPGWIKSGVLVRGNEAMSPLRAESDIRDARVDSQKACAKANVLRQEKIVSRRIPLFSGTRLISFSKSVRRKMPRSQVSAFMFSRAYNYFLPRVARAASTFAITSRM